MEIFVSVVAVLVGLFAGAVMFRIFLNDQKERPVEWDFGISFTAALVIAGVGCGVAMLIMLLWMDAFTVLLPILFLFGFGKILQKVMNKHAQ